MRHISDPSIDAAVRTLLRELRLRTGIRQAALAQKLGQAQSFVSKYELGERDLTLTEIRSICIALGSDLPAFIAQLEERISEAK